MKTDEPRFWATIEYIRKGEAIVTLLDVSTGTPEWSGYSLVQVRSSLRADLYEAGYRLASANASWKGGRLDRYVEALT